ncbi:unnamed protein product [Litomosoides sigmodontis]|uniref:DUF229 domain-containing protein n=1 Tax=Litomosoides sigmodontis TaxID=42156 RepID=A0A3P6V7G7_LITSI|nr:unnamed protein product [Litomosoides sigmodontis]
MLPIIFIPLFIFFTYSSKYSTDTAHWIEEPIVYSSLPHIVVLGADTADMRKSITRSNFSRKFEQACRIPKLNINGSEVIAFFHHVNALDCSKNKDKEWAYVDEKGLFTISADAIETHGDIKCTVAYFERINDNELKIDRRIPITSGSPITQDYAVVHCIGDDQETWEHLLWTIVPDRKKEEALSHIKKPAQWSGLDVYFIGFDSLSQMSFRRKLPKTVKYIEEELDAVVLDGYNIVGDGTPQAFIPILTGQTEQELPLTRKRFAEASYVDEVYPFVWKNFSDAGYITLYAEDSAKVGTFTYRLKGFKHQPTDHYVRTFFQKAEDMFSNLQCLGSVPMHKEWFRYTAEFMERYGYNTSKFLLAFHSVLSHDDVNLVEVADEDTMLNLKKLKESGVLDNALVIVMADHGHRFAKFRATHQGQLEERLPFFSLSLPKKFRESDKGRTAWKNLKANKARLSTPFDIHATLLDVLHWPAEQELNTMGDIKSRSLSLFRPISPSRTCEEAGIEMHWCTCMNWESAMDNGEQTNISVMLSKAVVQTINSHTKSYRHLCAPLKLVKLESSRRLVPHKNLFKYKNTKDVDGFVPNLVAETKAAFAHYQLRFVTKPGNALYEATVQYDVLRNTVTVDMTSISHINRYGDLSHCIIDINYFLAAYCICYDKINSTLR